MQPRGRLHYVDWLRVSAFAILLVYHSSVAFFPDMKWLIESTEKSAALGLVMDFPRAWRLPLLFFVSGMGTWFACRSVSAPMFLRQRMIRLLLPLLFAMCVIIVPQVWYERMYEDGYSGSLLTFWTTRYFMEGKYPEGHFTWAHMWFVAYLLIISVVCYPIFRLLPRMNRLTDWFERVTNTMGVYLFFLLPLALNLVLSLFFPRQTNALYNDGAWFAVWASWFGLGFLIARHHGAVIASVIARRWLSAGFAAALTAFLYRYAWTAAGGVSIGGYADATPIFKAATFALAWTMILALVGFGARYLNRSSRALTWLNRRIFPLYIVHQTVTVATLFYILPLELSVLAKYAIVLSATAGFSLLFAAMADYLPWPIRALVGLPDDAERIRAVAKRQAVA